jgi:hypothetical protein
MTRPIVFKTRHMFAMLALVLTASPAAAQAPAKEGPNPKPDKEALSEEETESRRAAEKLVGGIEVELLGDDKWTKVKRIEKALLDWRARRGTCPEPRK